MEKNNDFRDGLIVFDEPVDFGEGDIVYGILFNKEVENRHQEDGDSISSYVEYIAGMAQVCKYGIPMEDGKGWKFPKQKLTVNCDTEGLAHFVGIFFKDKVGFQTYTFDEPIIWEADEVDEDDRNIVVKPSLIFRYTNEFKK